jgi:hypothetical protein
MAALAVVSFFDHCRDCFSGLMFCWCGRWARMDEQRGTG